MILFGIVCFREKYTESLTYIDLISSFVAKKYKDENLHIMIFDNTDYSGWEITDNRSFSDQIQLKYDRDSSNPGIAKAYNKIANFAQDHFFSHIVFLDQDTRLPLDFYEIYRDMHTSVNAAAPSIYTEKSLISPAKYRFYRTHTMDKISSENLSLVDHTVINSGLMIRTSVFLSMGGYNEKLKVDFCDHEYIRRLSTIQKSIKIIPIRLVQDFSTDTNTVEKALFRYDIYVKDLIVFKNSTKHAILITMFVDLPHLLRLSLKYKTLRFFCLRFKDLLR